MHGIANPARLAVLSSQQMTTTHHNSASEQDERKEDKHKPQLESQDGTPTKKRT